MIKAKRAAACALTAAMLLSIVGCEDTPAASGSTASGLQTSDGTTAPVTSIDPDELADTDAEI